MAKFRFRCEPCSLTEERYTPPSVQEIKCIRCNGPMVRLLPSSGSHKVTEVVDSFTNVKQEEDQKKKLEQRRSEYFWSVEVPRMVQTYSLETCLQEGWVLYNEKGELVLGKGPKK